MGLMHSNITNTALFQFNHPELSLGQVVKTEDGYFGVIVGLDFYPETKIWNYGVCPIQKKYELIEEMWYEAQQLKIINSTWLFQFPHPQLNFGQKVKTKNGLLGYVVGLDFYPKLKSWTYGVYLVDRQDKLIEEIWYDAEEVEVLNPSFVNPFISLEYPAYQARSIKPCLIVPFISPLKKKQQ